MTPVSPFESLTISISGVLTLTPTRRHLVIVCVTSDVVLGGMTFYCVANGVDLGGSR